jgi:hypothetical protein
MRLARGKLTVTQAIELGDIGTPPAHDQVFRQEWDCFNRKETDPLSLSPQLPMGNSEASVAVSREGRMRYPPRIFCPTEIDEHVFLRPTLRVSIDLNDNGMRARGTNS